MQTLIAAIITGMVVLSSITIVNQQKKSAALPQIQSKSLEIQKKLRELVRDDKAWKKTVADTNNASMACLRSGGVDACIGQAGGSFAIWDADSASAFYDPGVATAGFNHYAAVCNSYVAPPATGTDQCPFRVTLTWTPVDHKSPPPPATQIACSAANNSERCIVRVTATFTYNPGADTMKRFSIKSTTYSIDISRETGRDQATLEVIDRKAANVNGGACTGGGTWDRRVFNRLINDTGANVFGFTDGVDQTTVTIAPGSYECDVIATAHVVTEHQARLVIPGGTPSVIVGTSAYYYAPSNIRGSFTISANTAIYVEHICANHINDADFGAATGLGGYEVYSMLKCKKF